MNKTALITGASDGIGLELAKIHASKGDDLVLVARTISKLNELKSELETGFGIKVYTIQKDLSVPNAAREVYDEVAKQKISIHYLINNAGFGDFGPFHESDWDKQAQMINLNILSLTQLTKLYLEDMIRQGGGKIMNLASTAAFQPGPLMAVYFATKAYVLHFSEAINNEVKEKGITVTALCPGPTESGFKAGAKMEESSLMKGKKLPSSKEVAEFAYRKMMQGKPVAIHGIKNYIQSNAVRFAPRALSVKIARAVIKKN
ncbi:SDR family NAD(P)-dependent oxidoreductase [Cyclobacterium plantarum]|uniref:SDR family oxidoreductase n=1 Tax=Cyclobacterium plantarum TaxID=2716263 RepID=A0ABX0HF79_9BACT|nr:SDR family oxidoreductase [Cyclobacterium plantarum]NHE59222.1 SDR family oxidoreductase [Cyclobacterium plantarum]